MIRFYGLDQLDPVYKAMQLVDRAGQPRTAKRRNVFRCRWCETPTEPTESGPLRWCRACRSTYMGSPRHYCCHVPHTWSAHAFFRFWNRGVRAATDASVDLTFTRYFCDRLGLDFELALAMVEAVEPTPVRFGELAMEHKLLSREEVKWILDFQRTTPPNRRAYFGEIAVRLGLWTEELLAPLLLAQAERTRAVVPTIARRLDIASGRILEAERSFFGLYPTRFGDGTGWPIAKELAA